MAKRLSITIPDGLSEKLESYRGKINISSICSQAIEREINQIKDYVLAAKKRFYILTIDEACNIAYELGKEWAAKESELEELAFVCEFNENNFFSNSTYPDFVRDAVLELLMENEKFEKLYNNYYGSVYDYFSTNASFIAGDIIAGFMGEDGKELYGEDATDYEIETINYFIKGARLIWNEIREAALVRMLGRKTTEELKEKIKKNVVKEIVNAKESD